MEQIRFLMTVSTIWMVNCVKGLFKKKPPFSKLEVPCLFKWQKVNCSGILDNNGIGNCLPPQKIRQETSAGNGRSYLSCQEKFIV